MWLSRAYVSRTIAHAVKGRFCLRLWLGEVRTTVRHGLQTPPQSRTAAQALHPQLPDARGREQLPTAKSHESFLHILLLRPEHPLAVTAAHIAPLRRAAVQY